MGVVKVNGRTRWDVGAEVDENGNGNGNGNWNANMNSTIEIYTTLFDHTLPPQIGHGGMS
jgi:hypothetical protein